MKVQIFATPNLVVDNDNNNKTIQRYKQEIENLKSIIQSLMKMNNNQENNSENDFNKDELIKVMAEEASELKQGNKYFIIII